MHLPGPNLTPAETWTLGHRNPYGLAFAPDGRLWETEMGPRGGDELNLIEPGKNYGWPRRLGGQELRRRADPAASRPPRIRAAQALLGTLDLADQPADLHRQSVPAVEGQRLDRDAVPAPG